MLKQPKTRIGTQICTKWIGHGGQQHPPKIGKSGANQKKNSTLYQEITRFLPKKKSVRCQKKNTRKCTKTPHSISRQKTLLTSPEWNPTNPIGTNKNPLSTNKPPGFPKHATLVDPCVPKRQLGCPLSYYNTLGRVISGFLPLHHFLKLFCPPLGPSFGGGENFPLQPFASPFMLRSALS